MGPGRSGLWRSAELGEEIRAEDGVAKAVRIIDNRLAEERSV